MITMPRTEGDETFLTTQEACTHLGVSRQTINRYVNSGKLHQYKRGVTRTVYYKLSELNQLSEFTEVEQEEEE